jgi:hypothetical protein
MKQIFPFVGRLLSAIVCVAGVPWPAHAAVIQLASMDPLLRPGVSVAEYTSTDDLLPSPLVLTFPENVVTFTLAQGDWRRADQSVNFIGDFDPWTRLLYTNNNGFLGFDGVTTVGGGGSGPVDIEFARGVRIVGLRAQSDVIGPELFTFEVYNGPTLLDTFTAVGESGQRADEQFAVLIGAIAIGDDVITRLVISSLSFQGGEIHPNRFAIGPLRFVPEPAISLLLTIGLAVLASRLRRAQRRQSARMVE